MLSKPTPWVKNSVAIRRTQGSYSARGTITTNLLELITEDLANTPEGRLLQSVRRFVAEVERLKIIERTRRGMRARVESGKPLPGRKPPFGYRWTSDDHSQAHLRPEHYAGGPPHL